MMNHPTIVLAVILTMTLAAAHAATSQPSGDPAVAAFVGQLVQKLALTAEQQAKIQTIAEDAKAAIAADPSKQDSIVKGMYAKIAEQLTPAQQETFRQVQGVGGDATPATSASAPAGDSYQGVPTAKKLTPFKAFNDANEPVWFDYVRRSDPAFKYDLKSVEIGDGTLYDISNMVSQVWGGMEWKSPMQMFIPGKSIAPDTAVLFIQGILPGRTTLDEANELGLACAVVGGYSTPAWGLNWMQATLYSVQQCLETGDPNWALVGMYVKSAVRAMDVIEAVSAKQGTPIKKFILAGHSRCGYTCYATAVFDPRVIGFASSAGHIISYEKQMQIVSGYIARMLQPGQAATEVGRQYLAMVDPYLQRAKMTMPKLDICGTNDDMFPPQTLGCFWPDLPGPKYLLQVANATHGVMEDPRVFATIRAFARAVATGKALPTIEANFIESDGTIRLELTTSVAAKSARLWTTATVTNVDSSSKWTSQPMDAQDGGKAFAATAPKVSAATQAAFAEVEFEQDGRTFCLTTEYKIVKR